MSEDVPNTVAVETVPAEEPTAVPETVEAAPEPVEEETRTFTQEELDAQIGKRLARERRKWEREHSLAPQPPPASGDEPQMADFDSAEEYAEAKAHYLASDLARKQAQQREVAERVAVYQDREEEARQKYDDFEAVAYNPTLPITDHMAATIQSSEIGPELIYHLGQNPKEAARISQLSPLLQAREIGKLEATLASAPPVKRTSTAPAPINPVAPRSNGQAYDTTDPRSLKQMGTSAWIEADRQRLMRKAEARR